MAADLDRLVKEIEELPREQRLQLVERLHWDGFFVDDQSSYGTPGGRKNETRNCEDLPGRRPAISLGSSGRALLRFAGTIDQTDLVIIEKAIDEGCEVVDPEGW